MAKTREQKQQIINKIEQELKQIKSLVFVDYYGLKVSNINELKALLKQKACKYLVAKKSLLKIAMNNIGLKHIDLNMIKGGVGMIFSFDREIEPARVAAQFAKTHKQLSIQGGIFNSEFVQAEEVKVLANLPSRDNIITQLVGTIKAPLNNLVYVMSANIRGLVQVLGGIKK